jgi:hypothetical protein
MSDDEPVIMVAEGSDPHYQWRQYFVITDGRCAIVEMLPAMLCGWKFHRVTVQSSEDWPGMSRDDHRPLQASKRLRTTHGARAWGFPGEATREGRAIAMATEEYIPNARDATMGFYGQTGYGYRARCVRCHDKHPLVSNVQRIYGDLYCSEAKECDAWHIDRVDAGYACELCGVTFQALSEQCQREHDEQQARWARLPVTHVVEMGMVGAVRCRIY